MNKISLRPCSSILHQTPINLDPDSISLVESENAAQEFIWALTSTLALEGGVLWTSGDTAKFIDERLAYYGGILWQPLNGPKFHLEGTLAVIRYDNNSFIEGLEEYLIERRTLGESVGTVDDMDTAISIGIILQF